MRVMHYMNQFFAGKGGEDKADVPAGSIEGATGPGKRLQEKLGDDVTIVVTAYCGDNRFSENTDESLEAILKIARGYKVDLLVAGPAFDSGRHGFACAQVCHAVSSTLGLYCVSAMYPENPGISTYKQYKDEKAFVFPTTAILSSMEDALSRIAQCVLKLVAGSTMGPAAVEGYIPRGIRRDMTVSKNGIDRAVAMLLDKIAGRPFLTEIPVERLEMVPVAPRLIDLKSAIIALGTTTGVVPKGNPDGFLGQRNTQWKKYSIANLDTMKNGWDVMHAGYNNVFMKDNPNLGVPLDAARVMEKEEVFGKLYPYYYMTTGNVASIPLMQRLGQEMAADMKAEGVDAVLLTSA
ncbi:glycine/betaine/sarcosine/D-proline family reductase selenoprotein B [Chloroflexota bacterium]